MLDASAVVLGLTSDGDARRRLAADAVACPHLVDAEVAHALRSQLQRGVVPAAVAQRLLHVWQRLGIQRLPQHGLLGRVWELRDNLSAYDACYVALAEALEVDLVTADARLAGAPGPRCTVVVVRS